MKNSSKGITLIALVVTIIVLIILAGVSINLVLGENGIITMAKRAKEDMEKAAQDEQLALDNLYMEMDNTATYNEGKKVNEPMLLTGMTPIKFTEPTTAAMGTTVTTTESDANWYEYGTTYATKRWANAQTKDGSMWVWIPRFAYKITGQTILCMNMKEKRILLQNGLGLKELNQRHFAQGGEEGIEDRI